MLWNVCDKKIRIKKLSSVQTLWNLRDMNLQQGNWTGKRIRHLKMILESVSLTFSHLRWIKSSFPRLEYSDRQVDTPKNKFRNESA